MGASRARAIGRTRPIAAAAGAWALAAAWVVGVAIARLTGAAAVVLVLAAAVAGLACAVIEAWRSCRSVRVAAITTPETATAGDDVALLVEVRTRRPMRGSWRLLAAPVGDRGGVDAEAMTPTPSGATASATGSTTVTTTEVVVRFPTAGVFERLGVTIETAGWSGLLWWQRTTTVTIDPIHVAPVAEPPLMPTTRRQDALIGEASARRGSSSGDVDGVRPWRHGESALGVHWPSSLRAGELIVHDRHEASNTRWIIEAPSAEDAGRVRYTIEEGLRRGHTVSIDLGGADPIPVRTTQEAARVCAEIAGRGAHAPARRHPRRRRNVEGTVAVSRRSRWVTALASALALAMVIDALGEGLLRILMVAGALAVGAVVTNRFSDRDGSRPLVLRIAVTLAAVAALVYIGSEANGLGGLLAALRGPLPDLLILLVVLHGFEVSNRRTLRVHQALSFIVAVYAAGLRIDDRLGWWLGSWAIVFVVAVTSTGVTSTALTPSARTSTGWKDSGGRSLAASARSGGTARAVAGWAAIATTLTLAILVTVPVPRGPASLGLPALSTGTPTASAGGLVTPDGTPGTTAPPGASRGSLGQTGGYRGFSETLDTSVRGGLGDDIVMRVRSPEPAFWRGQTFSSFDGRTWTVSPDRGTARQGPRIEVPPTLGDAVNPSVDGRWVDSEELVQTFFIESELPNIVFGASRIETVVFDGTIWTRPDSALRSDVTLTKGSVYTVVSRRNRTTAETLRAQGNVATVVAAFDGKSRELVAPFLELPSSTTARTTALAAKLNPPGQSTYDTVLAYEAWIAANTAYDLQAPVPDAGADAVDNFLFDSRRGFCEQIATTMAIMLRSQGVPTRLVTGYLPGERDRVSGVWKVRSSDAHSWVEVWFPQTGWEAFDPTADVPLAGDANIGTVGGDLISATFSTIASHLPITIGVLLLVLVVGACSRAIMAARYRRVRGRWGVLQDRFIALAGDQPATNPQRCAIMVEQLGLDPPTASQVGSIGETLDRAAFDPTWIDDDASFDATAGALRRLERLSARRSAAEEPPAAPQTTAGEYSTTGGRARV